MNKIFDKMSLSKKMIALWTTAILVWLNSSLDLNNVNIQWNVLQSKNNNIEMSINTWNTLSWNIKSIVSWVIMEKNNSEKVQFSSSSVNNSIKENSINNNIISIDTSKMDKVELDFYNKTKTIVDKINNSRDISKIDINEVIWLFNKWYKNYWYNKEIKKAWEKYLDQKLFWVDNVKFLMSQWNVWNILEILNNKIKFDKLSKNEKSKFYEEIYRSYKQYDEKFKKAKSNWIAIFDWKEVKEREKVFALDENKNWVLSKEEIEKKLTYSTNQMYKINNELNKLYATNLKSTSGLRNLMKKDYSSYSKNLVNSNQLSKIVKDIVLIEQYNILYDYNSWLVSIYEENLRDRENWIKTIDDLFGN